MHEHRERGTYTPSGEAHKKNSLIMDSEHVLAVLTFHDLCTLFLLLSVLTLASGISGMSIGIERELDFRNLLFERTASSDCLFPACFVFRASFEVLRFVHCVLKMREWT